jgi:hypothetical protein
LDACDLSALGDLSLEELGVVLLALAVAVLGLL